MSSEPETVSERNSQRYREFRTCSHYLRSISFCRRFTATAGAVGVRRVRTWQFIPTAAGGTASASESRVLQLQRAETRHLPDRFPVGQLSRRYLRAEFSIELDVRVHIRADQPQAAVAIVVQLLHVLRLRVGHVYSTTGQSVTR